MSSDNLKSSTDIFLDALRSLAEVTSLAVELMHRCAELLMIPKLPNSPLNDGVAEAQILQGLDFIPISCLQNI